MTAKPRTGWQTHSIDTVYDNPWIEVTHRQVTAPTGAPAIYGLVHFKLLAVAAVPLDSEGYTWLIGQHRYTIDQYSWEVPEGGGVIGEDSLAAARRELQEETGIRAARWTPLLEMHTSNSVTDEKAVAFLAQDLSFETPAPDATEQLEVRRVKLETAIEMVLDGRITDGFAMACLMKLQLQLDRGTLSL